MRLVAGSTTYALAQTSYDGLGRVQCVAQRMNPSEFTSLPSDACTLDTEGSHGPDRIARTTYDNAGQVTLVETGYGVSGVQANEVATAYTNNGQVSHVTDANGNRTTYEYDGHDRLVKTRFPSPTTDNSSSTTDYEQLTLDANGNVTTRRLRDGTSIVHSYDNLNRLTARDLPNTGWWEYDQSFAYDNLGRLVSAGNSVGHVQSWSYDALSRLTQETSNWYGVAASYGYDAAGRMTRLTWPDGLYVDYVYDTLGEMTAIRENGATSGVGVLAVFAYDDRGRRTSLTRGNGTVTSYSYDAVSRLSELVQNLSGTSHDLTLGFSHNPASQIATNTRSNDSYAWTGHYAVDRDYTANGLNRYSAAGPATFQYDARGNLTSDGSRTYAYTSDNLLATAPGAGLVYDALGRLLGEPAAGTLLRYGPGSQLIAENDDTTNAIRRRYVPGPGTDEPIVWYEGTGTSDRRWLHADERGSIVAVSNASGAMTNINAYDEAGIPAATNVGRFQYTGQQWIAELGMYHYRARIYSPYLGRFLQTDPIGYGDGMNLYAYVGNDPVNFVDPSGLTGVDGWRDKCVENCGGFPGILVTGPLIIRMGLPASAVIVSTGITSNESGGREGSDEADRPFCDEPGADQENCNPVVTGDRLSNRPTFLPPSILVASISSSERDYCGAGGSAWVPDRVGPGDLRSACLRHDECYATAGARKFACDLGLGRDVFAACMAGGGRTEFCAALGSSYFWGVTIGGHRPFRDAQRNARRGR